jgi:iron-sulfur cluster repair protein YtfE (RIC family)
VSLLNDSNKPEGDMIMAQTHSTAKNNAGSGALIGAAVAGLAVGLAANFGRKAVVQGMTVAAGQWDEGLKAEHAAVLKIFDQIEKTTPEQTAKRKILLMKVKHALTKHALQEEQVVYPALRDFGLKSEADALTHDHGYVKQYLFDLVELDAASSEWIDKIRAFRSDLENHIEQEENTLFPQLCEGLGEKGNTHITTLMNKAGFFAA